MYKFVVGEYYRLNDGGFDPIMVTKRTPKMIFVKRDGGAKWRMRIREDRDGNEYATDSTVPQRYRCELTYQAKNREDRG